MSSTWRTLTHHVTHSRRTDLCSPSSEPASGPEDVARAGAISDCFQTWSEGQFRSGIWFWVVVLGLVCHGLFENRSEFDFFMKIMLFSELIVLSFRFVYVRENWLIRLLRMMTHRWILLLDCINSEKIVQCLTSIMESIFVMFDFITHANMFNILIAQTLQLINARFHVAKTFMIRIKISDFVMKTMSTFILMPIWDYRIVEFYRKI